MMQKGPHKEKRLHEGGVGPEMRSPAGLRAVILAAGGSIVNPPDDPAALVRQ